MNEEILGPHEVLRNAQGSLSHLLRKRDSLLEKSNLYLYSQRVMYSAAYTDQHGHVKGIEARCYET